MNYAYDLTNHIYQEGYDQAQFNKCNIPRLLDYLKKHNIENTKKMVYTSLHRLKMSPKCSNGLTPIKL
jgi:hypothetical protein